MNFKAAAFFGTLIAHRLMDHPEAMHYLLDGNPDAASDQLVRAAAAAITEAEIARRVQIADAIRRTIAPLVEARHRRSMIVACAQAAHCEACRPMGPIYLPHEVREIAETMMKDALDRIRRGRQLAEVRHAG